MIKQNRHRHSKKCPLTQISTPTLEKEVEKEGEEVEEEEEEEEAESPTSPARAPSIFIIILKKDYKDKSDRKIFFYRFISLLINSDLISSSEPMCLDLKPYWSKLRKMWF